MAFNLRIDGGGEKKGNSRACDLSSWIGADSQYVRAKYDSGPWTVGRGPQTGVGGQAAGTVLVVVSPWPVPAAGRGDGGCYRVGLRQCSVARGYEAGWRVAGSIKRVAQKSSGLGRQHSSSGGSSRAASEWVRERWKCELRLVAGTQRDRNRDCQRTTSLRYSETKGVVAVGVRSNVRN